MANTTPMPSLAKLRQLDISQVEYWVFDLDNTIYPANSGLFSRVAERMTIFIMEHFDLDHDAAAEMKTRLFRQYGTTMRGLMSEFNMDPELFLAYVHEIDLSDVEKDRELDQYLSELKGRKLIYTNGTVRHASRILEAFGIMHHFDFIFDIFDSDHTPKPDPRPYQMFVTKSGIDPRHAVMIEDMARNLEPAAALGMKTVWLANDHDWGQKGAEQDFVHFRAADLKAFLSAIVKL